MKVNVVTHFSSTHGFDLCGCLQILHLVYPWLKAVGYTILKQPGTGISTIRAMCSVHHKSRLRVLVFQNLPT